MENHRLENLLHEAREGSLSAGELDSMRQVLQRRRRALREELENLPEDSPERPRLEKQLETLQRQVAVLAEEAAISAFVEDSTLAVLHLAELRDG